jgi:signal transduction histidine kinase
MSEPTAQSPRPENTLRQLEEAGALSHFASSIAHEVCNPLSQIVLATDLLAGPRPLNEDLRKKITGFLRQGADRIDKAMKQMLRACAPIETSMTPENVNTLLDDALAASGAAAAASIHVEKHYGGSLPPVLVDRQHVTEAITHVISNAIDAMMPTGGTLTLKTELKVFESSEREGWQRQSWFRAGDRAVVIEITDTGHGIEAAKMPLIFEPFYTTKPAGKGAGLGLTVAKKIVDLHYGRLEINNRREGGVRATLTLKTASHI